MAEYDQAMVDLYSRWEKPDLLGKWQSKLAALKPRPADGT
jgi:hypothetical protein